MTRDEWIIGNDLAAARVELTPSTWRAYVTRGQAPAAEERRIVGGHAKPAWRASTLDRWRQTRHGKPGRPPKAEE